MRHNSVVKKFGRSTAHRKALMRNMVTNLILQDSIRTTLPKAKEARKDAEKMVTMARKGTLAARRNCSAFLQVAKMTKKCRKPSTAKAARALRKQLDPVRKLFDVIVPAMADRTCGYTRIVKLNRRRGDAAQMCLLQWVTVAEAPKAAEEPAKTEEVAAAETAEQPAEEAK
ncbi:MAG: 50S ribosomal protein L17 [Kiritimatiellae bacterium]|nr:50S ribosomal protein L17 [Kiritimatiellia bacterium]